jgi:hypothetical protein
MTVGWWLHVIRLYFWLMLALQEAKLSLKGFRQILFSEPPKATPILTKASTLSELTRSLR